MKIKNLFIVFFLFFNFFLTNGQGKVKMVFRYDDYLLVPSKFSDSLLYIFQRNNIPLCLGIIPYDSSNSLVYNLNSDQINDLKSRMQRKEIEIALHGFNHSNILKTSFLTKVTFSEFVSLDFDKQYEKLARGKKTIDSLFNINTNIFIPPFNTYDKNTLRALDDLGFEIISASTSGTFISGKIKYIPATCADFSELPKIINSYINNDVTIIFYFHPYSFKGSQSKYPNEFTRQISLNQLDTLLIWVKKQNINSYTFSDLAKIGSFDNELYRTNFLKYNLLGKILYKLKLYRFGVYSTPEFNKGNTWLIFGNIILHLFSFLFVYFFIFYLVKILRTSLKMILIFLGICSIPIFIYLIYIRNDFSLGIILIILLVNVIALIFSLLRTFKPSIKPLNSKKSK